MSDWWYERSDESDGWFIFRGPLDESEGATSAMIAEVYDEVNARVIADVPRLVEQNERLTMLVAELRMEIERLKENGNGFVCP